MVIAHGGTAGGIAELAFVLVPVIVFAILSRRAAKKTYKPLDHDDEPPPDAAREA